ncbi:MAG: hypothetical protein ACFCVE_14200 [Phycisphaerae bacterium]
MNIISRLKGKREERQQSALERYYAFVRDFDNLTEKQLDELDALLREINITPEQMEEDVKTAKRLSASKAYVDRGKQIEQEAERTVQAHLAACAESQRVLQEQRSKVTKAIVAQDDAHAEKERLLQASRALREFKADRPEMYRVLFASR